MFHFSGIRIWENPAGNLLSACLSGHKDDFAFIIMEGGVLKTRVSHSSVTVRTSSVVVLPAYSMIEVLDGSEDFQGFLIVMEKPFTEKLCLNLHSYLDWKNLDRLLLVREGPAMMSAYRSFVRLIIDLPSSGVPGPYDDEVMLLLTKALIYKAFGSFGEVVSKQEDSMETNRKDKLSQDFLRLVNEHGATHRDLDFYADKLCVSTKYLSYVISRRTGKKALKWIEEFTVARANKLLRTTDLTISQISEQLNFFAPSDFCRYFRKATGITPRECRKSLKD